MSAIARAILRRILLGVAEYWLSEKGKPDTFFTCFIYPKDTAMLANGKRVVVEFRVEDWTP